jgi:hypothetical protein
VWLGGRGVSGARWGCAILSVSWPSLRSAVDLPQAADPHVAPDCRAGKAVIADRPVPATSPLKRVLDVEDLLRHGIGRFKLVAACEPPAPLLPDLEALRRKVRDG